MEGDKAWEVSLVRRCTIAAVTYAVALALLLSMRAANPLLSAVIPAVGYVLSTLSLPYLKAWWLRSMHRR